MLVVVIVLAGKVDNLPICNNEKQLTSMSRFRKPVSRICKTGTTGSKPSSPSPFIPVLNNPSSSLHEKTLCPSWEYPPKRISSASCNDLISHTFQKAPRKTRSRLESQDLPKPTLLGSNRTSFENRQGSRPSSHCLPPHRNCLGSHSPWRASCNRPRPKLSHPPIKCHPERSAAARSRRICGPVQPQPRPQVHSTGLPGCEFCPHPDEDHARNAPEKARSL